MATDRVLQELARGSGISIIDLVDGLIEKGKKTGASDIHLDPTADGVRVRLRIDGVLQDAYMLPKTIQSEVVSRIKVLASLRTDEHQMTQDGRFRHKLPSSDTVDLRVSIAPTYRGEDVVLRLLVEGNDPYTLATLGFSKSNQEKILRTLKEPSGMILATGPTGSGKTTTLHTLLRMLNTPEVSIITLEDPIEYAVEGVEQIQVNNEAGITFANGLRSVLRQDPNIIMVGEIRDTETASIAINTALTGHLLLSTLHTNDAATTLPRLLDMKVEPFLLASTMRLAIGQRLVRKICAHCKEKVEATASFAKSLASLPLAKPVKAGDGFSRGQGCDRCEGSGYSGRISINEVLMADDDVRNAILNRASSAEVKRIAVENGMTTMLDDGFEKARAGETTVEEILRVIHE
jgi:type IV pilus assembly protein PilB